MHKYVCVCVCVCVCMSVCIYIFSEDTTLSHIFGLVVNRMLFIKQYACVIGYLYNTPIIITLIQELLD